MVAILKLSFIVLSVVGVVFGVIYAGAFCFAVVHVYKEYAESPHTKISLPLLLSSIKNDVVEIKEDSEGFSYFYETSQKEFYKSDFIAFCFMLVYIPLLERKAEKKEREESLDKLREKNNEKKGKKVSAKRTFGQD